ncbi:lycopene cyclase family protein [soil metagenome]
MTGSFDILVLGKGPAGVAAAAELAARGLRVGVLGPGAALHWPAQYGAWSGELEALGRPELAEHHWPETVVGLGGTRKVLLHGYVRVDRARLARELEERCAARGVMWLDGRAAGAAHHSRGSTVRCADGREIAARVVVDASGHRPVLVRRASAPAQGFQTAVGLTFEVEDTSLDPRQAILMDWDDAHLPPGERVASPPTFLYAMPLGEGRVFAEETVLVGRPAVPYELLERRLRLRLEALGMRPGRILEREECFIPMGGALPDLGQRVVGFGGAGGMVHPATGYLLTRVLADAPLLAEALAEALGAPGAEPHSAARAAWEAIWPADRRRRRELYCFGMEALLRLDTPAVHAFFESFFSLPDAEWQGYLNDRLTAAQLAAVMGRLFARAPGGIRRILLRTGAGSAGRRLAAGLLRGG